MILCIESLHCFTNLESVFCGVRNLLAEPNGNFIIADVFDKKDSEKIESLMKEYFIVEKKESITINVKHAMNLDKERVENIVSSMTDSLFMRKIMRGFFASA